MLCMSGRKSNKNMQARRVWGWPHAAYFLACWCILKVSRRGLESECTCAYFWSRFSHSTLATLTGGKTWRTLSVWPLIAGCWVDLGVVLLSCVVQNMEHIDSENLILEVEQHSCIYGCKLKDFTIFSNRELKRSSWQSITMTVIGWRYRHSIIF